MTDLNNLIERLRRPWDWMDPEPILQGKARERTEAADALSALMSERDAYKEVLRLGMNAIDGDAVGAEWKRQCNVFLRHARAALAAKGPAEEKEGE
jgi:hypothetical protein